MSVKRPYKYEDGKDPRARLHPGEPFFFIRAQDALSVEAVRRYSQIMREEADKLSNVGDFRQSEEMFKQSLEVLQLAKLFQHWQMDNAVKVKLPD